MNPNLVSSGVVNNSFLNENEFSDLLEKFYVIIAVSNLSKSRDNYYLSQNIINKKVENIKIG